MTLSSVSTETTEVWLQRFCRYHFSGRQVILLTHDRIWYTELKYQLPGSRWDFKTLLPYETPAIGIRLDNMIMFYDARAHLKDCLHWRAMMP